jgi:hypothetical protein
MMHPGMTQSQLTVCVVLNFLSVFGSNSLRIGNRLVFFPRFRYFFVFVFFPFLFVIYICPLFSY